MAKEVKKQNPAPIVHPATPAKTKSDPFQDAIKKYLDQRAREDELFAATYANPKKSIADCCAYIINEVQRMGVKGLPSDTVYNMAVHYYDEADLKGGARPNCKIIVDQSVELTEDDKAKAREKAIELATAELKDEVKKDLVADIKLTEGEIADARKEALNKVIEETKEKMAAKKKPEAKKEESKSKESQNSLF
jgi:hypothetical protein